ncbi:MAG: hypothetical protein AB1589_09595 [Cyanobacteriota bacterium]
MPISRLRLEVRQKLLVDAACLISLILTIIIITWLYISSERNFHWWIDWYEQTLAVVNTLRQSSVEAFRFVNQSLNSERNRLFTLPLIPFFLLFGSSRLVYQMGLSLVYLLPFALVMGAIATQIIPVHSRTVFWSTAFLTLLLPVSWIPTFMGIPDTGGAVFIGLATFVYLQDVKFKRWWRIPLIGFFIGAAILLRRHFIYGGLAFLGALTLQALIFFIADVQKRLFQKGIALRWAIFNAKAWRNLLVSGVQIGLIGVAALVTVGIVAPKFTYAALTLDYKTLYTSWSLPFSDIFNLYALFYGWGTWLIVAIGFSASLLARTLPLAAVSFMGWTGVLSLIIWLVHLRYGNIFYSLQVTPFVVIGLVTLIWTTWITMKGKERAFMLGVVGCYLVANLIIGLTPVGTMSRLFHPLFALSMPPLVRTDYDEAVRLVNYLRLLTPDQEPIFVVGYQRLQLTSGMVRAVEQVLYPREERFLNVLSTPEVDSRDAYPLERLLEAQYVVIPTRLPDYSSDPTQLPAVGEWLPNKELDVVNVVFDAFTQNWEFARDFKRLPAQFAFENGVVVNIYQRFRPTSLETAVRTLDAIQQKIAERPGSQGNWVILSQWLYNTSIRPNPDYTNSLVAFRRDRIFESTLLAKEFSLPSTQTKLVYANSQDLEYQDLFRVSEVKKRRSQSSEDRTQQLGTSLLYLGSVSNQVKIAGYITYIDRDCVGSSIRLAMLDRDGKVISSIERTYKHNPKTVTPFELPISGQNAAYLLFDLLNNDKNNLVNSCTFEVRSFRVSNQSD